jgi:hypothetical protein
MTMPMSSADMDVTLGGKWQEAVGAIWPGSLIREWIRKRRLSPFT